jgi:hypothetical protein
MMDLKSVASEIREIISERQKSLGLVFEEDNHIYTMGGRQDYPSVSKILKKFYREFPTDEAALRKSGGDPQAAEKLKEEWEAAGLYSTNMGSRVHFILEKKTIERNGNYKEVRQPIFTCDPSQLIKGDAMIKAGEQYIKLMEDRGAVLLDTEMVLGDPELGYVGQPDKVWIIPNRQKTEFGLVITDWKTNKPKNFETNKFTKQMKTPLDHLPDNALGHYKTQLPLYGKLLLKMLEGSKYENIQLLGCIIVLITEEREYVEHRVDKKTINTILEMNVKQYLKK